MLLSRSQSQACSRTPPSTCKPSQRNRHHDRCARCGPGQDPQVADSAAGLESPSVTHYSQPPFSKDKPGRRRPLSTATEPGPPALLSTSWRAALPRLPGSRTPSRSLLLTLYPRLGLPRACWGGSPSPRTGSGKPRPAPSDPVKGQSEPAKISGSRIQTPPLPLRLQLPLG